MAQPIHHSKKENAGYNVLGVPIAAGVHMRQIGLAPPS
jgi:hypothetical protein